MKYIFIISLILGFTHCTTNKPLTHKNQNPPKVATSTLPEAPPLTPPGVPSKKSCEEILAEVVSEGWDKYDARTSYPGFIENLDLMNKIVDDLNTCIIGKNKEFVTKIFGEPSDSSIGIFSYHCYVKNETNLLKAKCLTFRMKDGKTITSVSYEDCGYKKL